MPLVTKPKICNNFSFATGSWLKWHDEAPTTTQEEKQEEEEDEESQSIDSDHSSNFFHNWSPTVDKMIIDRRASFLQNLEAQIAKDNLTFELLGKCFLDQRPLQQTVMNQFASIVLRDGLVELDRIEKQIAEDEAILQKLQVKAPPAKVSIVNVLKEAPKQKDPLITYWKFPCRTLGKEPAVPKGTSWKDPANQQKPAFNPRRFNTGG